MRKKQSHGWIASCFHIAVESRKGYWTDEVSRSRSRNVGSEEHSDRRQPEGRCRGASCAVGRAAEISLVVTGARRLDCGSRSGPRCIGSKDRAGCRRGRWPVGPDARRDGARCLEQATQALQSGSRWIVRWRMGRNGHIVRYADRGPVCRRFRMRTFRPFA